MGELLQNSMTCDDLASRVVADGGTKVSREAAVHGSVPSDGHYIALFYRPLESCDFAHCGKDFHFMRRDAGGAWSHKTGEAPVTDRDADGKQLTDPEVGGAGCVRRRN